MSNKKIILFVCIILFTISNTAFALEKETHYYLNQQIALSNYNSFLLDSYLKNNLGMAAGVKTIFQTPGESNEVDLWMAEGGRYEDEPMYTRSMNHFHDPLKDWGSAGFKGVGHSSAVWAQYPPQSQIINGNFSWNDVRSYYYWALTATDQNTRDTNYANCFRGLGQLMHLIQDASVPAHTRNDFHYIYNYEDWVQNIRTIEPAHFASIVNTPALSFWED